MKIGENESDTIPAYLGHVGDVAAFGVGILTSLSEFFESSGQRQYLSFLGHSKLAANRFRMSVTWRVVWPVKWQIELDLWSHDGVETRQTTVTRQIMCHITYKSSCVPFLDTIIAEYHPSEARPEDPLISFALIP